MVKNPQINNDEINFVELTQTVWNGKWKIAVVVAISIISMMIYQFYDTKRIKTFTAITKIKPLSSYAINEYYDFNNIDLIYPEANLRFQKITKSNLLNLYISILNEKSVFEDAMHKFNLLDASQYSSEQKYNEAIIKLSSSIQIKTPLIDKDKKGSLEISFHTINFKYHDVEKWLNVLKYSDQLANELAKKTLVKSFNSILSVSKKIKENEIKNLKRKQENDLEDLTIDIKNSFDNYDSNTSNRLAFLKEQSEIAKELGIENSTLEVQTLAKTDNTQKGFLTNIHTSAPFYLRGFKAINKEIDLILNRQNKEEFIDELLKLEQSKRSIVQDKNIERLKKNKFFEIVEEIMQSSPLGDNNEFYATSSINVFATEFLMVGKNYKMNMLATIVMGLIVGVFYVTIFDAFQSQRISRKKLFKHRRF